jgi:Domain of unknown function DUF11
MEGENMCEKKPKWVRLGIWGLFFGALALAGLLMGSQPASAQSCISEQAGKSLVCTANDIQVAFADNVRDTSGKPLTQCTDGQTFSFIADFHVTTTASTRYDIGLYFATDGDPNGDGARSGVCSANIITPLHTDPASPGIVTLGSAAGVNKDGDTCLDVSTDAGWGKPNGKVVTVRVDNVLCQDSDGDGKLNLPNCTSWSQNSGSVCNTATDAAPGSPSKCSCDLTFNIPVFVETGNISVVKTASPASLPEPGGQFTYTVTVTNTAKFTNVTLDKICDDKFGLVDKVAAATACPAGTLGSVKSETCSLPQMLPPGGQYSCDFKADLISNTPVANVTDTVTVSGHDQNNKPVSGFASASVAINDVAPAALVTKAFDSLQCATVRYKVDVKNTDPAESLTLTTLSDDTFGSITSVHDAVDATTCVVPQTIASGATYSCTFDATFCDASSHTDKVTAKLHDNDNPNTDVSFDSNSVTVNVSAQQQP